MSEKVGCPDSHVYAVDGPMHDCMAAIRPESAPVRMELASIGTDKKFVDLTYSHRVTSDVRAEPAREGVEILSDQGGAAHDRSVSPPH